jgi:hypothetical protein
MARAKPKKSAGPPTWSVSVHRPSSVDNYDGVACESLGQCEQAMAEFMERETEVGTSLSLSEAHRAGHKDLVHFYLTPTGWRRAEKMSMEEDMWLWTGAAARGIPLDQFLRNGSADIDEHQFDVLMDDENDGRTLARRIESVYGTGKHSPYVDRLGLRVNVQGLSREKLADAIDGAGVIGRIVEPWGE